MSIQVRIPPALAAVHNFIRKHDAEEIYDFNDIQEDPEPGLALAGTGELARGPASRTEKEQAAGARDLIAQAMWEDYQALVAARAQEGII